MENQSESKTYPAAKTAVLGGAAFLAMTSLAMAGSLYVAPNGSDSNPGTLTQPFKTINQAANTATPGTNVIVRAGTYTGAIWIGTGGTSGNYIRFYPYPGEAAIIDGTGIPSGTDLVGIGGNYVEIRGFEIRNNLGGTGVDAWCTNNTNLINNVVHNIYNNGIFVGCDTQGLSNGNIVQGNIVYDTVLKNSPRTLSGGWNQAISISSSANANVSQNTVYKNYGEGIGAQHSSGIIISGNTIYDNYSVEIYLDGASFTTVNGNFIYNTGNPNFTYRQTGSQAIAIGTAIKSASPFMPLVGLRIVNNISSGGEYGFYYGSYGVGGGIQNSILANNTFTNTQRQVVHIDPDKHSGDIYMNNIHYLSATNVLSSGSTVGWTFNYNNWYGGAVSSGFGGPNDILANPALVQPGASTPAGYIIRGTSPDANSGIALSADSSNFWGNARIAPYNIGAH